MKASLLLWLPENEIVSCRITVEGKRREISTGFRVLRAKWDSDAKRMRGTSPAARSTNDALEMIISRIRSIEIDLVRQGKSYSAETLKSTYEGKLLNEKGLIEVFDLNNRHLRSIEGEDRLEDSTLGRYDSWKDHTKAFIEHHYEKSDVFISEVDEDFLANYKKYLTGNQKYGLAHTAKHLGSIKTVMKFAVRKKFLVVSPLEHTKIKRPNYNDKAIIFLDEDQLARAEAHTFENKTLQRILDVGIFQAHTALAWREAKDFEPSWLFKGIDGRTWISFVRQKTKRRKKIPIQIPLDDKALEIYNKYLKDGICLDKNRCLPVPANAMMNRYLKVIAAALDLYPGLSCHHFRKTAGMIWLNNDVPEETVAAMMGDGVAVVRKHYARVIEKKIARDMAKYSERMNQKKVVNED